jgi:Subtilase family
MQHNVRAQTRGKLPVRALGLLLLAIMGIGLAGNAAALDPPGYVRKGAKKDAAPKAPFLGKGSALVKGSALGKGAGLDKGAALSKGPALDKGAALSKGPALDKGTALRKGPPLDKGAALGKGPASDKGKGSALDKGAALGKGPASGKGPVSDKAGHAGNNQRQPAAALHRSAALPHSGQPRVLPKAIMQDYVRRQPAHREAILAARSRLPFRPLPGERGFTGVPPTGETRFVSNEMVFRVGANVSPQAVDAAVRRLGLSTVATQESGLTGGTLYHLRVADGRQVAEVVRALEAENIGVASPNYVYRVQQDPNLAARTVAGDPGQYVVSKLRLPETHRVATGSNVLVAVIDSAIDLSHPDLTGAVVEQFDAVGRKDRPHVHGTGMAGAIAARRKLLGVAPSARILAVHAFSPEANESAQATTRHIIAGLEWAIKKGARVINMSFAGPYDPMLQLAMKNAREKGVVLIAAAGNMGPSSPPLYPAADPNVIAVTATDENDKLFAQANQGPHVAVAAPGVDILEPAPDATYQVTTGTSVAAAHVSGVAALMIERNPSLDPVTVHEILTMTAKSIGSSGRDDKVGWGLVDPARALDYVDAKVAEDRKKPAKPTASKPGPISSR